MKKILHFLLCFMLSASLAYGAGIGTYGAGSNSAMLGGGVSAVGCTETCGDYLLCQNFETATTGYDNSEAWSETVGTGGSVEAADTTATVMRGNQQLKIDAGNAGQVSIANNTNVFASKYSTLWAHFRVKFPDATPASRANIFQFTEGTSVKFMVQLNTDGTLRVYDNTNAYTGSTVLSNDTMYHVWVRYTAASVSPGGDGILTMYLGTTSTRPVTAEVTTSVAVQTASVDRVRLYSYSASQANFVVYFDQLLVDSDEIGNVCD